MAVGIQNVIELFFMGCQFLALTAIYDVKWPFEITLFIDILSTFIQVPILNDIRQQHVLISYIFPISLSLVILLCFKSMFTVLKEILSLFSAIGLSVGIYSYFNNLQYGIELIYICGITIIVLLLDYGIRGWLNRNDKKTMDSMPNIVTKKASWKQIRNLYLILFCIGLAVLFMTAYKEDILYFIIIVTCGALLLYNYTSNLFVKGQKFNTKLNYYFRKYVVQVSFFVFTVLYIPLTMNVLRFIIPTKYALYGMDVTCSSTQLVKMKMPFEPYYYGSQMCLNSINNPNSIPMTMSNYHLSVPINQERFYSLDTTIPYYSEVAPFFLPGSLIAFLFVTIGLPWLYFKLVHICFKFINGLPLRQDMDIPDYLDQWAIKSEVSNNCCRSLYVNLKVQFKDFKLILLAYRFLIVMVVALTNVANINSSTGYVFLIIGFVHAVGLVLGIVFRPFNRYLENILFCTFQGVNLMFAVFGALVAYKVEMPSIVSTIFIAVIVAAPIIAIAIGFLLDRLQRNKLQSFSTYKSCDVFVTYKEQDMLKIDMKLDKQLQFPIAGYFTTVVMLLIIGAFLSIYGINTRNFTYVIRNGRSTLPSEVLKSMNLNEYTGPYKTCMEIKTILSTCSCVDMHLSKVNETEIWKCVGKDELMILQRRSTKNVEYDDMVMETRPYCSREYDSKYLNGNYTINKDLLPSSIEYDDFNEYYSKYC